MDMMDISKISLIQALEAVRASEAAKATPTAWLVNERGEKSPCYSLLKGEQGMIAFVLEVTRPELYEALKKYL